MSKPERTIRYVVAKDRERSQAMARGRERALAVQRELSRKQSGAAGDLAGTARSRKRPTDPRIN